MPNSTATATKKTPSALSTGRTGSTSALKTASKGKRAGSNSNVKKVSLDDDAVGSGGRWIGSAAVETLDGACLSLEQISELYGSGDMDDAFGKMACYLGYQNWREDMLSGIFLSYYFGVYQFAKENSFTAHQTNYLLSIMKHTLASVTAEEDRSQPPLKAVEKFRKLVMFHSAPLYTGPGEEPFGVKEAKVVVEFAMTGLFQHYKLYQYVTSNEQEKAQESSSASVDSLLEMPEPLAVAVTLEAYEAEQARLRELEEQARLERERWEAEERAAAANPFDVLSTEEVKDISIDVVTDLIKGVADEVDGLLGIQKEKLLAQTTRLSTMLPLP
ncbi:flagellar C1a complex subunit C1a-32-domain-containing protein [Chytriomyces sp. MP71]|nr:flagellar C1a complex subunit C1a-32-domain-containing protein [Chytriomyces sp. MP71]